MQGFIYHSEKYRATKQQSHTTEKQMNLKKPDQQVWR
jgi:hypothetical protein